MEVDSLTKLNFNNFLRNSDMSSVMVILKLLSKTLISMETVSSTWVNLLDGTSPEWNSMAKTRDRCLSFKDMLPKSYKRLKTKPNLPWLVKNLKLKLISLLSVLMIQEITPDSRLITTSILEELNKKKPSTSFQAGCLVPQIKRVQTGLKNISYICITRAEKYSYK